SLPLDQPRRNHPDHRLHSGRLQPGGPFVEPFGQPHRQRGDDARPLRPPRKGPRSLDAPERPQISDRRGAGATGGFEVIARLLRRRAILAAALLTAVPAQAYYHYVYYSGRTGPFTPIRAQFNLA